MEKAKVLYVAKTLTGGSAFSLYYLVRGLQDSRYQPVVLLYARQDSLIERRLNQCGIQTIALQNREQSPSVMPTGNNSERDIARFLSTHFGEGVGQVYRSLKDGYRFARMDLRKVRPIARLIREHQVALVHINSDLRSAKPGIVAAWITGRPCVCHTRVLPRLSHFDRFFARFVDRFIYISTAVAQHCAAQGIPAAKGTIVHNAVDLDEFTLDYDTEQTRNEFGWSAQERLVGIVGRLDWWKGHEHYMQAMARVIRQMPNARGLIVGGPESSPRNRAYYQDLIGMAQTMALEDKVIFTGFRSDVPRLMSAMDVVVLSSSSPEPFGRVVIEGMAAGKPVVATAAGGVLDIVQDGVTGILVPPRDAQAMAQAILDLLNDREAGRRMGMAARRRVEEKFTVQSHVTTVQEIYDSVLATGKAGCAAPRPRELKRRRSYPAKNAEEKVR